MTVTFPSLTPGAIILAAELNSNFADAINATRGLTTANLASNAGLVSGQLADRFSTLIWPLLLLHRMPVDLSAAATPYTMPNVSADPGTEQWRIPVTLRTGRAAYLVSLIARAEFVGATASPKLWVGKNGILVGNAGVAIVAANTDYPLQIGSPFDNPLGSVADGDYYTIGLGHTGTPGASMYGLSLVFTFKVELGA